MSDASSPPPLPSPVAEYLSKVDFKEIIARLQAFVKTPLLAWETAKLEPLTVKDLYQRYIIPISVAIALCNFIGWSIIGPFSIGTGILMFIQSIINSLVFPYLALQILKAFAPTFGASVSESDALKIVVFACLPLAPIGLLGILPLLAPLMMLAGIAGLAYMLYLIWLGLPILTGVSIEKRPGLFIAYIASVLVVGALWGWILTKIF